MAGEYFGMGKIVIGWVMIGMALVLAGCGGKEDAGAHSQGTEMSKTTEEGTDRTGEAAVPVAEYSRMWLPLAVRNWDCFEMDEQWLYFGKGPSKYMENGQTDIYRNGIFDAYDPELYLSVSGEFAPWFYVTDKKGGLFLYGQEKSNEGTENFSLEKYDKSGVLQWRRDYAANELGGGGERLKDGLAAPDGGVFLYAYGDGGRVVNVDEAGDIREVYVPKMDRLEGLAVTETGTAYAYGYVGTRQAFEKLGGDGEPLYAPVGFKSAFGGREGNICLCTSRELWEFMPDAGDHVLLWRWNDEYVQLDGGGVETICYADNDYYIMGREWNDELRNTPTWKEGEPLAFAKVSFQDAEAYPGKKTVTLARAWSNDGSNSWLEDMILLYNRQSREYSVKLENNREGQAGVSILSGLEQELLGGAGPDLIELSSVYAPYMARKGMLEDLTGYYDVSSKVRLEDLLPQIREAGDVGGQNVLVIPSFYLRSYISNDPAAMEEWTIWRFLELSGECQMTPVSSPYNAFAVCTELNALERFVDYEAGESHFDSPEFARLLEECAKVPVREVPEVVDSRDYADAAYRLGHWEVSSMNRYLMVKQWYGDKVAYQGMPGWEGAQHGLCPTDVFAMNNASKNKEGAWDFLEFLLSKEAQDAIDWAFPSRESSFESYLERSYVHEESRDVRFGVLVGPQPEEEDFQAVRDMVSASAYTSVFEMKDVVRSIVREEAGMYLKGDAGLEETVKKIQNRVSLYLGEM